MLAFRNYSIRQKLTWMNMLVSGAALLLACTAFAGYELADFRQTLVRSLSIQAQIVGANSASALLLKDPDGARETLAALRAAPDIVSGSVFDSSGKLFARYSREGNISAAPLEALPGNAIEEFRFTSSQLIVSRAIDFQGRRIGTVRIRSDLREVNGQLLRYAGIVMAVLGMSLLAAFAFSSVFQKATARPIVDLARTARMVSREKQYSIRAPITKNADEIAVLIEAFNEMLEQIQQRDTALQNAHDELELRVERRTGQLEAVNKELESFTYSVAHDLRAPLRHIQGFADALKEDYGTTLDSAALGYINRIVDGTRRMDELITDLLALAQVGRQELVFRTVELDTVVQDAIRELAEETQARHIEWRLGKLPAVECDPRLIRLAFYNLLSNAVKYTRPRDPAMIEIGETSVAGERVIFVRDNGVGFNMKYAHKLFGVFERLHRREDFEGTGVGLATVQRIVHKHGGRIWAEAEPDRGATFYLTLGRNYER